MYKLCIFTLVCTVSVTRCLPVGKCELAANVHGIVVEEDIPVDKVYPMPQYVAPVIIEGSPDVLHLTAADLTKDGHVGYAPADCLQGKLIPVDDFNEKYELPANVEMYVVDNAEPNFDVKP